MPDTDFDTAEGFALLGWPCRYTVIAHVHRMRPDGWQSTMQLPTFHLDTVIHGITGTDHAERIAREMLTLLAPDATFTVLTAASFDRLT